MNKEAESLIRSFRGDPEIPTAGEDNIREAMRWAYADAAKIAMETRSELGAEIAGDIEARAK